jgi:hypothetical protein
LLSVTLTYFTDATERENLIEACNGRLRRWHLTPRLRSQSAPMDAAKVAVMRAKALSNRLRSRSRGSSAEAMPA